MRFPAVPERGPTPAERAALEPPSRATRRLGAFPWVVLGGAVGAMGLLAAMLLLLDVEPHERAHTTRLVRAGERPAETLRETTRSELPVVREPELEPRDVVPVAATSDSLEKEPPAEWPPARAFTARCKAPRGGCVAECTTLAGGRCLDPCFIHTAECSNDCKNPDGTCGWPPPDSE